MNSKIEQARAKFKKLVNSNNVNTRNIKIGIFETILKRIERDRTSKNKEARENFNKTNDPNNYAKKEKLKINSKLKENNQAIKNYTSKRKTKATSKIIKHPWYLAKVDTINKTIKSVRVEFPVLSKKSKNTRISLTIDWAKNNNIFPLSQVSSNANNSYITSQSVGRYCISNPGLNWCRKNHTSRYSLEKTEGSNKFKIKKNGASGVGVPQMSKELKKQSLAKIRRSFLDLKRSGDYGQILTCKKLNDDDKIFIINPGSVELAKEFMNSPMTATQKSKLEAIKNNRRYAYHEGCFWSFDRPACLFAFLIGVPVVFQKGKDYYSGDSSSKNNLSSDNIYLQRVLNEYNKSSSKNDISGSPYWYILVSIIDTAHDFGHGSRIPGGYQFKQMIKDVLKPLVKDEDHDFIENVFVNITKIEDSISKLLINKLKKIPSNFNEILDSKNRCIIYDAGNIPVEYRHRSALLSAKYVDPSST